MAILVTGGAGFIGSNFILDWFALHNECVVNLDKLTYAGNLGNLSSLSTNQRYIFIHADINDKEKVEQLLNDYKIRAIVHFAAESHVDRSISGPEDFIQTNIVGTFRLLEASLSYWRQMDHTRKENFRFVHVSTDEVYGSLLSNEPAFNEASRYEPNSPYSASKAASDHLVRAYHHTYGLPVVTTNCSNNYGPFQYPEKLIPCCIKNALSGNKIPVYGDGLQIRDWLYVGDHCAAIRRVLDCGRLGDVYTIGGWNEQYNIDVVKRICTILDTLYPRSDKQSYLDQITYINDRAGHDRRYAVDATKIKSTLDWQPKESFETGLKKTVAWYINSLDWFERVK
jgi:dTDP-glucose 4,6-dehydratase